MLLEDMERGGPYMTRDMVSMLLAGRAPRSSCRGHSRGWGCERWATAPAAPGVRSFHHISESVSKLPLRWVLQVQRQIAEAVSVLRGEMGARAHTD